MGSICAAVQKILTFFKFSCFGKVSVFLQLVYMVEIDVLFLILLDTLKSTFLTPRFHLVLIYSFSIFCMYCKIGLKYLSKGPKFLGPLTLKYQSQKNGLLTGVLRYFEH